MKRLASFLLIQIMMLSLAACGEGGLEANPQNEPGVKYGRIGDAMSTEWFDFTVTDAYRCFEYRGYTPCEGYTLVVVTLSLKNSCGQPVEVWGEDFSLIWGGEGDAFGLDIPLPAGLSSDQFPDKYVLDAGETRSGVMVFEAPREFQDFSFGFIEIYDDGAEGDTFFVELTAEDRG